MWICCDGAMGIVGVLGVDLLWWGNGVDSGGGGVDLLWWGNGDSGGGGVVLGTIIYYY